jgi:hypothetical protein
MDNLEKFIEENRPALDRYTADKRVWRRIRTDLNRKKSFTGNNLFRAAMILFVFGTAFTIYKLTDYRVSFVKNNFDNSEMYIQQPQLKETELYYNSLINNLYKKAVPLLTGNPEIEYELKSDFSVLDSLCTDIKSDLKDNVANQEVVEALIRNYRAKIQILEDMLSILQEENGSTVKPEGHEL